MIREFVEHVAWIAAMVVVSLLGVLGIMLAIKLMGMAANWIDAL